MAVFLYDHENRALNSCIKFDIIYILTKSIIVFMTALSAFLSYLRTGESPQGVQFSPLIQKDIENDFRKIKKEGYILVIEPSDIQEKKKMKSDGTSVLRYEGKFIYGFENINKRTFHASMEEGTVEERSPNNYLYIILFTDSTGEIIGAYDSLSRNVYGKVSRWIHNSRRSLTLEQVLLGIIMAIIILILDFLKSGR